MPNLQFTKCKYSKLDSLPLRKIALHRTFVLTDFKIKFCIKLTLRLKTRPLQNINGLILNTTLN